MRTKVVVTTHSGDVVGATDAAGILSFKGIPYAAPPIGSLRFQPPAPHEKWSAPRQATDYGPTSPQGAGEGPVAEILPNVIIPGDDYLNLNVWTPATDGKLPVMVFIHGGAFTGGSGAVPAYSGAAFARDGVVLVTINYRLGADGFLWFGDGVPNLGMLDQVAALEWVRDNIAAFGGDPANITIFGESAGAMSVCTLIAMPRAKGLFRRAIAESGAGVSVISPESARLVGNRVAAILGVAPNREAIATVPMEKLLAAATQVAGEVGKSPKRRLWGDVAQNLMPYEPVVDGDILPTRPIDAIRAGAAEGIDVMIGTNTEEARLFTVPTGVGAKAGGIVPYLIALGYKASPLKAVRTYRRNRPGATPGDIAGAVLTDWYYRIPAIRLAEAKPGTHMYDFAWRSPAFDGQLGACHGLEIAFVFDVLDDPEFHEMTGSAAPQALATAMHKAWVDFATTGNPGWPAYSTTGRATMRFDTASSVTLDDRADERELWPRR
jgi:para-nitrobenzyl esterase